MIDRLAELLSPGNLDPERLRTLRLKILAALLLACLFVMFAIYMVLEGKSQVL